MLGKLSLKKVNDPQVHNVVADIVFIHGLAGSSHGTWTYPGTNPEAFWPEWLANYFPNTQIWTLEHPTDLLKALADGDMTFYDRTSSIMDVLASNNIGSCPILFISHSLGGILAKAILRKSVDTTVDEYQAIAKKTLGVVFLATPHHGSTLASFGKYQPIASFLSKATKELHKENPYLMDLYDWYKDNAPSNGIETKAYYETKKYKSLAMIVSKTSAAPGVPSCQPIAVDADHEYICKFENEEDEIFKSIKKFIERQFEEKRINTIDIVQDDLDFYTTVMEGDRKTLHEKLVDGNRAHEIEMAERAKEQIMKRLTRFSLSPEARKEQESFLSEILIRFNKGVAPKIREGESEVEVNGALMDKVIDPISKSDTKFCGEKAAVLDINNAIYYLTGNCHIRWSKEDV